MMPDEDSSAAARQILIVGAGADEADTLRRALDCTRIAPLSVRTTTAVESLPAALQTQPVDVLLSSASLSLAAVLQAVHREQPGLPVVVAALSPLRVSQAVAAMRLGAAGVAEVADREGFAALLREVLAQDRCSDAAAAAQAALRASEERYRSLIESTDAVISVFDASGTLLYANAVAARPFGVPPEAMIGRRMHELFPPSSADRQLGTIRRVIESGRGETSEAESIVEGRSLWYRTSVQPVREASGKITSALINAVDITERARAAHKLEDREKYFHALIDSAHDLTVVLDAQLGVNYVSSSVLDILGHSREAFVSGAGTALNGPLVHPEDVARLQQGIRSLRQAETAEGKQTAEVRLRHADGSWRMFEVTITNLLADASVAGLVVNARDVTERRAAEAALRHSEARLHSLVASQTAFNTRVDMDGRITYCNPRYEQQFAREDGRPLLGIDSLEMVAPEDHARVQAAVLDCLTHIDHPVQIELRKQLRDGSTMWTLWEFTAVREADGVVREVQCVGFDISQQKRAEIALQESRALLEERVAERTVQLEQVKDRLEAIFNHSGDGILLLDLDRGIQQANTAFEELFGQSAAQYIGKPLETFMREADAPLVRVSISEAALTHSTRHIDVQIQPRAGGERLDIEISLAPVNRSDKQVTSLVCIIRDVSKRKAAERALRDSEIMLQNIIENIPVRLFWKDLNSVYRGCNTLHAQGNGLSSPADIIGKTDHDFLPERAGFWAAEDRRVIETGEKLLGRIELVRLSTGEQRWLSSNKVPLRDSTGAAIGVLVTIEDVTARKEADLAVAEERNLLRTVIDAVPDFIYVKDTQHRMLLNNIAHVKALGADSPADLLHRTDADFFPAEMARRFRADEEALFATGQPMINLEETTLNMAREPIHALTTKVPLRNLQGEMIGLIGITHDISAIKEKELAFRASEERYQTTVNTMSEGLVLQDGSGAIILCNSAAERILGLTADQMRGVTSIDSRWQSIHEDGSPFPGETHPAMRVLATGAPVSDVVMGVRLPHDGSTNWILINSMPLHDPHGALMAVTTFTDITARKRAEEALRENEARYRLLAENVNDAIIKYRLDGECSYATPSVTMLLGYTPEELTGVNLFSMMHPDDIDECVRISQQALAAGETSFRLSYRARCKDGGYTWFESANTLVRDPQTGETIEGIAVFRDVSARRHAEEALRLSEEKFRTFIESAPIATVIAEADGRIALVNREAEQVFGAAREQMVGRSLAELVPDTQAYIQHMPGDSDAAHALRIGPVEMQALRAGQQAFPADIQLSTVRMQPSPVIMCYAIDTTARKQAERELQALSQRLQLATQAGRIGIWDWDVLTDSLIWDEQMFALYGFSREQFAGSVRAYWNDVPMHPDDLQRLQGELGAVLASGDTLDSEFRLLLPGGEIRFIKVNAVIFRDDSGRAVRMIGVNWDLTPLREAEASLRIALEKEKELGELKSRFVSMASHEFRTPLAAIMATADTLRIYRDRMDNEQIDARLERILQQVRYMKEIMEDVLHLARIQAGRVEYRPEAGDLDQLCQEVIEEFESQSVNRDRIVYTCTCAPAAGQFDARLMRQIVGNLISNALKYSPVDQPIHFSLDRHAGGLVLRVRDHGIGIPPEDLRHLFEPFHRATNVGTISGTGLGLSITRRAVELHGGTIEVDSVIDAGTTFTVTLPVLSAKASSGEAQHD
jgi:PAS domain S-box-containing protein